MNLDEQIRLTFPHHLAKLYEAVRLENEPRLRVQKLVDLFEEVVRYLALLRLAAYDQAGLRDEKVERLRQGLARPSLGHWANLMEALYGPLQEHDQPLVLPPPPRKHRDDAIAAATALLRDVVSLPPLSTIRLSSFWQSVVAFRNKKYGHGSMTVGEARRVQQPLEAGLMQWLAELGVLSQRHLVHVQTVEYVGPGFRFVGTNLNSGNTLDPFHDEEPQAATPNCIYLHIPATGDAPDRYLSLSPYFDFDTDTNTLFVFQELGPNGQAVLRCPYERVPVRPLPVEPESILGPPRQEPSPRPPARPSGDDADTTTRSKGYPTMRSWFDIITPHEDIRKGDFSEDIFAADIGDVHAGNAPADYQDPFLFFKKTYLTTGLEALLRRVNRKLVEGKGPSVIQIQTPFGGGKTHSLVAIYHYLTNGRHVSSMLPEDLAPLSPKVAVVSGDHWDPVAGHAGGGVTRRTFWGEVAYQLGGQQGYEAFRANDEARVSPGKARLRDFLEGQQPFVLLFDEILEYINRANDVRDQVGVSLGTQTLSFFQELTETVASLPRGMLIVTLPSSHLEDFGEQEEESLAKLGKVFGRLETIETPVQGEEVYAVIRRRLFEMEKLQQQPMREVVHAYFQQYQNNRDDLPAKARDLNYRDKMEKAYPFHPDVIDILYEKWSTYPTFQRTRGVLRLLANVVEDLYQRDVNIDLILPGDINMEVSGIREEFLKHVGREHEGVIASDIAGHEAKAQALDQANRQWKHLAQRIATAIFFHSFTADDSEKGVSLPYVKLATLRSETIPAMVTDVLQKLSNTLWYLNSRGETFYFSRIPNLNRMILDKKELFNESYAEEMEAIIRKEAGREFDPYVWPPNGDNIPDNQALKLVILHPHQHIGQAADWLERKGQSFREYKNTLFFAPADTSGFATLREDVKTYLALREIREEMRAEPTTPLATKLPEVQNRMHKIERDFSYNVRRMYHTVRAGERELDFGTPVTGQETLGHWFRRELTSSDVGAIVEHLHYRLIANRLMQGHAQLEIQKILEQFYKNTDLPAPARPEVIARAIQLGVQDGAFGLALAGDDGAIKPESIRFQEPVALSAIVFEPGIYLVAPEAIEKPEPPVDYGQLLDQVTVGVDELPLTVVFHNIATLPQGPEPVDEEELARAVRAAVAAGKNGLGLRRDDGYDKAHVYFQRQLPLSSINFDPDLYILSPAKVREILGDTPPPPPPPPPPNDKYHRIHLVISGIPASRIADVNRGVFMPLSAAVDQPLSFTMEIDVTSQDGITKETLENKVKETLRQIGARIEEEETE
jgi:hypothetical protein